MNRAEKRIILLMAIVYFISPIDLAPGMLVDDFVALFVALTPFFKKAYDAYEGGNDYDE